MFGEGGGARELNHGACLLYACRKPAIAADEVLFDVDFSRGAVKLTGYVDGEVFLEGNPAPRLHWPKVLTTIRYVFGGSGTPSLLAEGCGPNAQWYPLVRNEGWSKFDSVTLVRTVRYLIDSPRIRVKYYKSTATRGLALLAFVSWEGGGDVRIAPGA